MVKTGSVPLFDASYFSVPPDSCFRLFDNDSSLVGLVSVTANAGRRARTGFSKLKTAMINYFRERNHTKDASRAREESVSRSSRVRNLVRNSQRDVRGIGKNRALPLDANQIKKAEDFDSSQIALTVCIVVSTLVVFFAIKRMVRSFRMEFSRERE